MRERLRGLLAAYDWLARIHFALVTLGGLGVIGAAVSYVLSLNLPALLSAITGIVAIILGIVGWLRSREIDRDTAFWRERALVGTTLAEMAVEVADKEAAANRNRPRRKGRDHERRKRDR